MSPISDNLVSKENPPELFPNGNLSRITRSVSTPGEAEPVIQDRLKKLGMTFQEYVASLISYDCWAEEPHALTGDACKGHKSKRGPKNAEVSLWKEIVADYGKPDKTGSFFNHRVTDFVRKKLDS